MNTEEPHIPSEDFEQIAPQEQLTKVTGMYKEWFLDYASYVILERAVPAIEDGFKPVQRRIMHALKELDDGRYNKVANVVGGQQSLRGTKSSMPANWQLGRNTEPPNVVRWRYLGCPDSLGRRNEGCG